MFNLRRHTFVSEAKVTSIVESTVLIYKVLVFTFHLLRNSKDATLLGMGRLESLLACALACQTTGFAWHFAMK